jgi:TRAP-type mannitol/chloroaromatic compound transport system permease small subunit
VSVALWLLVVLASLLVAAIAIAAAPPPFVRISRAIDRVNLAIGRFILWFVLIAVLISAANAVVRKLFDASSNAFLEIQWYLFAAIFLLCAAYALLRNEHVRIDVISSRFSRRTLAGIDIFGFIFFLLPMSGLMMYLSWPVFKNAVAKPPTGETTASLGQVLSGLLRPDGWEWSVDAGGLMRWPVKILIPVGFLLLSLQGVSELIKRIAFLRGLIPDPNEKLAAHGTN